MQIELTNSIILFSIKITVKAFFMNHLNLMSKGSNPSFINLYYRFKQKLTF